MKRLLSSTTSLLLMLVLVSCNTASPSQPEMTIASTETSIIVIEFPSDRYPATAAHIREAIKHGETDVCTIDRKGAEQNRKESLKGIPTKKGFDRDEFPMAMCAEGGTGADVAYVQSSDNRGSGSWVGNALDHYPDGTKVKILVK